MGDQQVLSNALQRVKPVNPVRPTPCMHNKFTREPVYVACLTLDQLQYHNIIYNHPNLWKVASSIHDWTNRETADQHSHEVMCAIDDTNTDFHRDCNRTAIICIARKAEGCLILSNIGLCTCKKESCRLVAYM